MDPASFLRLPPEILDQILALLDSHEDILSFALTNRQCSRFAIPRHTEYRVLRIRHYYPQIWAHLAERADLAGFITQIHITNKYTLSFTERKPSTLVPPLDTRGASDETTRIWYMCRAINNMTSLRSFVWEFDLQLPDHPLLLPEHEDAILRALGERKTLRCLALHGPFGIQVRPLSHDSDIKMYPLWRFNNLVFLNLLGRFWVRPTVTPHLYRLLANIPFLQHLEMPLEFSHLHHLSFPSLRALNLEQVSRPSVSIDSTCSQFIEHHLTLEHLSWYPRALPSLTPEALPNLKSLSTPRDVVECLASVAVPPPTPTSLSFPVSQLLPIAEDQRETSSLLSATPCCVKRPIECLDVYLLNARWLLSFHRFFLDSTKLRKLKLYSFHEVSDVCRVGDTFPEITWLWLPKKYVPPGAVRAKALELEDIYAIVHHFPRLEVLRGQAVWTAVRNNLEQMHLAIFRLATKLPSLRQLDHCEYDDRRQAYKSIEIQRRVIYYDGEEVEELNYKIVKPRYRDVWDIFDGTFE